MLSPQKFANNTVLQFTLRQIQSLLTSGRFWAGLFAVTVILTIAGPFGTDDALSHAERFVYWAFETSLTFLCGAAVGTATNFALKRYFNHSWVVWLLTALAVGLPVSLIVWTINLVTFGWELATLDFYLPLLFTSMVISSAVTALYYLFMSSQDDNIDARSPEQMDSPFLKRLPVELGKNLLHISSQDHYVMATTERGSHLVLMRFSDAVNELERYDGLQIHRAHWVAKSAIVGTIKKDGRLHVKTSDSEEFPVSRTFVKEARSYLEAL